MIIGHGSKDRHAQMALSYIVDELKDSYRNVSRCWLGLNNQIFLKELKVWKMNQKFWWLCFISYKGAHVKIDINNDLIPALKNSNLKNTFITKHIGTDEKIINLIMERAKEVEDAN